MESRKATVLRHLGRIAHEKRQYELAEEYLIKALKYYEDNNSLRNRLLITLNLADLALQKGDLDKAWDLSEKAIPISKMVDDIEREELIVVIKAGVFRRRGDLTKTKALFEENMRMMQEIKRLGAIADTHFDLARIEIDMGNPTDAKVMLEKALDVYRQMGIHGRIKDVEELMASIT